jgi:hypothetical protein
MCPGNKLPKDGESNLLAGKLAIRARVCPKRVFHQFNVHSAAAKQGKQNLMGWSFNRKLALFLNNN